jgi:hypothetical protein
MIVIIAGMHRSGTSALAGMLHHNGIVMGEEQNFRPKPMKENPKGFYENHRFRVVNDHLLRLNKYRVKSFDPMVPVIKDAPYTVRLQMEKLIEEYCGNYHEWGWKDPRTCLTLAPWLDVIRQQARENEVRILVPCRATADIAASMQRRRNKGTMLQFEELARMYNKRMMAGAEDYEFMTVEFTDLMFKTEAVAKRLTEYLRHPITDTTFIEPEIASKVA